MCDAKQRAPAVSDMSVKTWAIGTSGRGPVTGAFPHNSHAAPPSV
jgi:hypothetical protein